MLLQTTYQDKSTQTEPETENISVSVLNEVLEQLKVLNTRVSAIEANYVESDHGKKPELAVQSEHYKKPELEGDVGIHQKTQTTNEIINAGTSKEIFTPVIKKKNYNLNKVFEKPYAPPHIQKQELFIPPQIHTYTNSLNQEKKTYNHITRSYIENIERIQNMLNTQPMQHPELAKKQQGYITNKLQNYNKLIALPGTKPNLVATCYAYGLISTAYTSTGEELMGIEELYQAFMNYKRVTRGQLFYIRFYSAPAEILFDEIKPVITVIKIGMTRDYLIPEEITAQPTIPRTELPAFYANKRIIGIGTILSELSNVFNEGNIWKYYSRNHLLIYSTAKEQRPYDILEIKNWAISLLKPEQEPMTKAIRKGIISADSMEQYCRYIGRNYTDHECTRCSGPSNYIPDVNLE